MFATMLFGYGLIVVVAILAVISARPTMNGRF
jgi:hypothetical protein